MLLPRRNLLLGAAALPFAGLAVGALPRPVWSQEAAKTLHGIAMHGEPKYGPDFAHFDYVDPTALKGGELRLAAIGTFDNLNPFILKGTAAAGASLPFETLTEGSDDEAFTEYGRLAETIEVPDDRSWVAFNLRPQARWHDGKPITVDDVIFSLQTLKEKGHPRYRFYYESLVKAEQVGERTVRFTFAGGVNRELPLITGQLPILPKHYWEAREFGKPTLDPPLGSGPYRIESLEAGRTLTLRRVEDYWGKDLPLMVGRFNWDVWQYRYFLDQTVAIEALTAGEYDLRQENSSKLWATTYDIPQVRDGRMKKELIPNEVPQGIQGFVYNIRKPVFQDPRVRAALAYAFDFEWSNKTLFYSQYKRSTSYFSNSELASSGLPSGEELAILEKYRGRVPDEVFTTEYQPPATDGSGNIRENLRKARAILEGAGWTIKNGKCVNAQSGAPFEFEILLQSGTDWERISLPFAKNLERLGIKASVRSVDDAQYEKRNEDFDFDMIVDVFGESLSPGNEQRDFWGSKAADQPGSRNTIGIKDPIVDEIVELIIAAESRDSLISRTRALDRALLWGHYLIPHWHINAFRVVYWDKFSQPGISPKYAFGLLTWWIDPDKAKALPPT